MQRLQIVTGCSAALGLLFAGATAHVVSVSLSAQTAATGEVLSSSGVISPIVADYDRSLQFYHGLLGLESPAAAGGVRQGQTAAAAPQPAGHSGRPDAMVACAVSRNTVVG